MTYRYKTRTRLPLNTGYRAGHTYDKAHAQQQQQRRVTQTLNKDNNPRKLYPKNISHNINYAPVQYQSNPSTIYFFLFFSEQYINLR